MKTLLTMAATMLLLIAGPALADRPAGYAGTLCDPDSFVPVLSERTGAVLYWNNPTCPAASGATTVLAEDEDEADKPKRKRGNRDRRGNRRGGEDHAERPFPGVGWGVGGNPRNRTPGQHPRS